MAISRSIALVASVLLVGCPSTPTGRIAPEHQVAAIEHRLRAMRSDTVDVFGMSSQGAQVAGHFEHDSLRRISGVWFGEIGRNEERYYFNAQGLFFVQEVALEYDSLLSGRVVRAETTITVLQDTVASAWRMTGGRRSILPHSEAADQARRVRTWADTLRFLLRQRSPYDAP